MSIRKKCFERIDKENNMTYFIKDNENIIILNTEESY